jgi:type I restriction enzyme S subunit
MNAATNQRRPATAADYAAAVPHGFKRTEVGLIPKGWTTVVIGDLEPFVTSGSRGWARFYAETGASFLRIGNLSREAIYLNLEDLKHVRLPRDTAEAARTEIQDGDLLISITADIGIVGWVGTEVEKPGYINQHIALIRFNQANTSSKFLAYYLASEGSQRAFVASTDVGAKTGMNLTTIRRIGLALPQPDEQRAIAEALSDVDGLLGALEALIAKKRAIKQAAMQQLLTGKTRLPGFSGPWETKRLGEIAEIEMGQSPRSEFYNSKGLGLPLIQGNADIANRQTVKRTFTTQITKRGYSGDILMSVRAPVGEVSRAIFDVCLGRGVCAARFPNDFLYHYLIHLEPSWAKHSKGSTFDSVNSADVRAVEIALPTDPAEQEAIATVLSDMDAEIAALERRRDKTRAIKQGMMQQLLTGRVRLVSREAAAGLTRSREGREGKKCS